MAIRHYNSSKGQVQWVGVSLDDDEAYDSFLTNKVRDRLVDEEGSTAFESHLRGLAPTGFAKQSLEKILNADTPESRPWAVGEAMAEAWLEHEYGITWPWNMERDKRNAAGSLPGADLVGFRNDGTNTILVLGEVKSSSQKATPPNVVYGRSGMEYQLDKLANDLAVLHTLLKWLLPRCKKTEHESAFNSAVTLLFASGNKSILLFGVLIRDTVPNTLDLEGRGQSLGDKLVDPTSCHLIAIYLPHAIDDLPARSTGVVS